MSYVVNMFLNQGTTWNANVVHYSSNTSGRFVINMAQYDSGNGAGQLRKSFASANATANLTVDLFSDNTAGIVTLSMTAAETSAIPYGRYEYDVEAIKSDGTIDQIVRGLITVNPQKTKWDW